MQYDSSNQKDSFRLDKDQNSYQLSKSQKMMAIFLAFFALFVVILWSVQFKKNLNAPFAYKGDTNQTATTSDLTAKSDESLKTKDTDSDGLSDWDELNVYKTSPYLADSDSDGLPDKQEVSSGSDPNCPVGRDCTGQVGANIITDQNNISSSSLNSIDQLDAAKTQVDSSQQLTPQDQATLKSVVGQNMDVATLRQMLLDQGMDKATLDKISDADLMKSFQEVLKQ